MEFAFELLEELVGDILEYFLGKLLKHIKVSKWIQTLLIVILCGFIIGLCFYFLPIAGTIPEVGSIMQAACFFWGIATVVIGFFSVLKILKKQSE